jgi:hypothetical protein
MHDEPIPFKPLDPGRVDMLDPLERHYWAREFHCTEAELAKAVDKVGAHVTVLREYLGKPGAS